MVVENWSIHGKSIPSAEDLNNPSLQCKVFDRLAVQNKDGITQFYCLELSAGNTFDFGFCRKENVPSLIRDVLTIANVKVLRGAQQALMVPSVPSVMWIKQARKYDPSRIIMWLENSIELTEEYKDCILRLRKMGMRFAIRVDAMGEITRIPEIEACLDFLLVDDENGFEYLTVIESLKRTNPKLKTIGFKRHVDIFNFTKAECKTYDYVLGVVEIDLIKYGALRPVWQHEMLRTFAQLYSAIYDVKEIGIIVSHYPLMATAMKGMMSSKILAALTIRTNNAKLAENQALTQFDLRNFLAISVAYNLFTLTNKQITDSRHEPFQVSKINYEPFIQALQFGKIVDLLAHDTCDDITAPQGFIAGFLRFAHVFLHDTPEASFSEFPLDAVSTCYSNGGGQLGVIIRVLTMITEHEVNQALDAATEFGLDLTKEKVYGYIAHSLAWTDAVIRAIGIIKEPKPTPNASH